MGLAKGWFSRGDSVWFRKGSRLSLWIQSQSQPRQMNSGAETSEYSGGECNNENQMELESWRLERFDRKCF